MAAIQREYVIDFIEPIEKYIPCRWIYRWRFRFSTNRDRGRRLYMFLSLSFQEISEIREYRWRS